MRLFVSVDLPEHLTESVAAFQQPFAAASGIRLTDPEQAHVTLKFLGETPSEQVPTVCETLETALEDAGVDPFTARVGGLGVFPSLEYISVVWLGLETGGEALTRLHEAIESRTTAIGFEPERHAFTPHVTIARMEHAGDKAQVQRLVRERDPTLGTMTVSSVQLTASTLTADGPVYSTVESVPLE